jgi:hypothetical protein
MKSGSDVIFRAEIINELVTPATGGKQKMPRRMTGAKGIHDNDFCTARAGRLQYN